MMMMVSQMDLYIVRGKSMVGANNIVTNVGNKQVNVSKMQIRGNHGNLIAPLAKRKGLSYPRILTNNHYKLK